MAESDVDVILHNYFATIAEKDSDALKLFEDNKRMRSLVERALAAREELEARQRSSQLLLDALHTELREKQLLIDAQDAESAVWRSGIAELRGLLDRPSELDHNLADVVDDVRRMSAELHSLRQGMKYAQWCCNEWEAHALESLALSENRERRVLEAAAARVLPALRTAAAEVRSICRLAAEQGAAAESAVAQCESWRAAVQLDREQEVLRQAQTLHRAEAEAVHHARRADAALQSAESAAQELAAKRRGDRLAELRGALELECQAGRVEVLSHRCAAAEVNWRGAVWEVRRVTHQWQAAVRERDGIAQTRELELVEREQLRVRVAKLSKKVEHLREQQSELEEAQQRCTAQQQEMQALRDRYATTVEKERHLRLQLSGATEAAAVKLARAEESRHAAERRAAVLEERLHAAHDESATAQKEAAALRRQLEQHHTTAAVLQATQQQLRDTEKHAFNFHEALASLKGEHAAQLQAERDRHAAEMAALVEAHNEALERHATLARSRADEAEARAQQAQETATREKEALQGELQAWTVEVDALKLEAARSHQRAEAEKVAREVLEQQSRSEVSVVRSMVERSVDDARRGPLVAELRTQLGSLQQRNGLLEEACRRGASVIAQLREALHRAQMSSRRTLQPGDDS
ncbi:hypothetical protein NESM_000864500 [Novymonas esmeraldas]|uniref:Uncharacterized protein n=1 Tax=Novymonas esmeraldas TaxID=1808958 RepID=A0AAW0F0Q8_9TRYP